ncbi:MAG TPA: hypothetical protein VFY17_10045, partial [Pilimelia sp.]|nr:hypothetical protein [Pilimelia sp.]
MADDTRDALTEVGVEPLPDPVPPPVARRRRWLLRAAVAGGVALAVVAAGLGWSAYRTDRRQDALLARWRCPGLPALATADYALSRPGGKFGDQCLGWTVTGDHPFGSTDPSVTDIIGKIVAENRRVREQAAGPTAAPYVRIAVLMPMTSAVGSAMGAGEIRHALWGAYAAQTAANGRLSHGHGLRDPAPMVQLVLANSGLDQTGWQRLAAADADDQADWPGVVDQLARLRDDREHPLVAVTGMGISVPATRDAAAALGRHGIPSIGAVVTADDMTADGFFKVSPSNGQYAAALAAALDHAREAGASLARGFLIFDRNAEDNFVQQLKEALQREFDRTYRVSAHSVAFTGSKPPRRGQPHDFAHVVDAICRNQPDVVLYAGRDRDLAPLVSALATRGTCQNPIRRFVIATGATGLTLTDQAADAAQLGVLDASATDPDGWPRGASGTPAYYQKVYALLTRSLRVLPADLRDGYALMHYDAVAAAVWATRRAREESASDAT